MRKQRKVNPGRANAFRPQQSAPQELFNAAALNKDFSNRACVKSWPSKTVILTGQDAGEEIGSKWRKWSQKLAKAAGQVWMAARTLHPGRVLGKSTPHVPPAFETHSSHRGALATLDVNWVEPGVFNGHKAHFIRLSFESHRSKEHYLECIELTVRVWRGGDALQSIAPVSHLPLSSIQPPLALSLAGHAPSIVLYAPRAVVGRPAGSQTEPYWVGDFLPDAQFRYSANAHAPHEHSYQRAQDDDPLSLLHIVSYGDPDREVPSPPFEIGFVVLSKGEPFEMTVYSTSFHASMFPVNGFLRTPYYPARFNGKARLIPKGQRPLAVDFASDEMREKLKGMMKWAEPFDTIWFGDRLGCAGHAASHNRRCGNEDCGFCAPVSRARRRTRPDQETVKRIGEDLVRLMYGDPIPE